VLNLCSNEEFALPWKRAAAVFTLLLGVYLATSSFRVETIDTGIRLEVARSLVERGSPDVRQLEMRTPFGVVGSFEGRGRRFYSVYGLGQSLLMTPFVLLGGPYDAALVTLINPIATAATCALLVFLGCSLGFSVRASTRLGLVVGLCTLAWPHSKFTFEAPLEMASLAASVWLLLGNGRWRPAVAGALFGFALLVRPSAFLMAPGLALLVFSLHPRERASRLTAFGAGCVPLIALALFYNWYRWGSPLASGYSFTRFRYWALSWEGFVGLLASPGRGFFWYSPLLLLAFFGIRDFRRRQPVLARSVLVTAAAYVGFLSFTTIWNGDWTWGPRHLLPIVPLVALLLLPLLEPGGLRRTLWVPLIAVSVAVQLVGATINYEAYFLWHNDRLRRAGVIEHAGRYHFGLETSQIYVEMRQALLFFSRLEARMREYRSIGLEPPGSVRPQRARQDARAAGASPYQPILEGSPRITKRVPDLWWIYFPLVGVPTGAALGLAALCVALIGGGALALHRIEDSPTLE
jgi:hypothetical protein